MFESEFFSIRRCRRNPLPWQRTSYPTRDTYPLHSRLLLFSDKDSQYTKLPPHVPKKSLHCGRDSHVPKNEGKSRRNWSWKTQPASKLFIHCFCFRSQAKTEALSISFGRIFDFHIPESAYKYIWLLLHNSIIIFGISYNNFFFFRLQIAGFQRIEFASFF
jgi:hypothetical protein